MSEQKVVGEEKIKLNGRGFLATTGTDAVAFDVEESQYRDEISSLTVFVELRVEGQSLIISDLIDNEQQLSDALTGLNTISEALSYVGQAIEKFGRKTYPHLYVVKSETTPIEPIKDFEVETLPNGDFNAHSKF